MVKPEAFDEFAFYRRNKGKMWGHFKMKVVRKAMKTLKRFQPIIIVKSHSRNPKNVDLG